MTNDIVTTSSLDLIRQRIDEIVREHIEIAKAYDMPLTEEDSLVCIIMQANKMLDDLNLIDGIL